jgi:esterase
MRIIFIQSKSVRSFLLTNLARKHDQGTVYWKPNLSVLLQNLHEIKEFPENLKNKSFSNPTLIIRGGNSPYVPDSDIDKIKTIFTKAQIVTIDNCGHWPHAEKPKEFLATLGSFLSHT